MVHSERARTAARSLTVEPIGAADHLAFVRAQRSVRFLQTPAWGRVKTEWRSESLGWFDGRRLVGAGLVLHRPVPRLGRFTLAYLPEGPVIKAAKEGVEVTMGGDLKAFHDLYVHTAERDRFTPRPLRYFETMFAALNAEDPDRIRLYLAHHRGDPVAATVLVRVGAHAWYSYGASSTEKREVRGSNACQWAMIRDSLAAGCDVYDLRGITPTLDTDDPHLGLIRFKVGTGDRAVRYVGEWDLPLRPLIYRAFDAYMKRRGQ